MYCLISNQRSPDKEALHRVTALLRQAQKRTRSFPSGIHEVTPGPSAGLTLLHQGATAPVSLASQTLFQTSPALAMWGVPKDATGGPPLEYSHQVKKITVVSLYGFTVHTGAHPLGLGSLDLGEGTSSSPKRHIHVR